jgi:hypothetical protein
VGSEDPPRRDRRRQNTNRAAPITATARTPSTAPAMLPAGDLAAAPWVSTCPAGLVGLSSSPCSRVARQAGQCGPPQSTPTCAAGASFCVTMRPGGDWASKPAARLGTHNPLPRSRFEHHRCRKPWTLAGRRTRQQWHRHLARTHWRTPHMWHPCSPQSTDTGQHPRCRRTHGQHRAGEPPPPGGSWGRAGHSQAGSARAPTARSGHFHSLPKRMGARYTLAQLGKRHQTSDARAGARGCQSRYAGATEGQVHLSVAPPSRTGTIQQ